MAFLKLIRFPNLLIVALTQGLLYFQILLPIYSRNQIRPALDPLLFGLLAGVTLLLTAGGYIINDIEDEETDLVNRKDRVIVGRKISRQVAYWLYGLTGISGFLLALFIAFQAQKVKLLFIYPLALGILYWYSKAGKKQPFIGNLAISLFCAGVAGIIWAAEWPALQALHLASPQAYQKVKALFIWYGLFAFLSNLYREIVKDIEDAFGDEQTGSKTLPVLLGAVAAKRIALTVGGVFLVFLLISGWRLHPLLGGSFALFLILSSAIPLAGSFRWLWIAETPKDFRQVSLYIKLLMVIGLLSLLFARF